QYSARFGSVSTFMKNNVRDSKSSGLALVVGLNQLAGGDKRGIRGFYSGRYAMSGSQLRSWGAQILADPYPCAFISWAYNSRYMNRSDIKSAKAFLAGKARSKGTRSCRGSKASSSAGGGGGGSAGNDGGNGGGSVGGGSSSIKLKVSGRVQSGRHRMTLNWSGARGSTVDVYRNGARLTRTQNDGHYVNLRRSIRRASYTFKICQRGTRTCSGSARVSF
ncbi:MAG TPA: hypothetical protein VFS51_02775, partial [Gemmatimonadales bacterium]|nr:hypothetical protein [Gemmatimonadales bacterium]